VLVIGSDEFYGARIKKSHMCPQPHKVSYNVYRIIIRDRCAGRIILIYLKPKGTVLAVVECGFNGDDTTESCQSVKDGLQATLSAIVVGCRHSITVKVLAEPS
jgi:hypothetical protein